MIHKSLIVEPKHGTMVVQLRMFITLKRLMDYTIEPTMKIGGSLIYDTIIYIEKRRFMVLFNDLIN